MKLGDKIRKIRKMKDLSQENIAEALNISHTAFAKIERGETNPSQLRIEQIANALEITKAELESFGENGFFFVNESNNNTHSSIFIANQNSSELLIENTRLNAENVGLRQEIAHLKEIIALLKGN